MPRRQDIDIAKGFTILLVVFGHLVARADPAGVSWYEPLRRAVYAFHIPFFLYLSGFVAVLSGMVLAPRSAWPGIAAARVRRLLLPFFALGLLIVMGKCLAARFIAVDDVPRTWFGGLADLVWHTAASPAGSIWYLFVLFMVSLGAMIWLRGSPRRYPALLIFCALLYGIPWPAYLYFNRIGTYAVFFALGAGAAFLGSHWDRFIDRFWPLLLGMLLCALAAIVVYGAGWPRKDLLLPVGMLAMPALHGLLRFSAPSSPGLLFLGRYSFMIYLFNTLCIGLTKGLLLLVCSWDGAHFLPFAAALMAAGTFGPIALKAWVFRRFPLLDRLTD
ncbi:MAG TPA: acyltransferase [Acidocella sp.]|jgi:fucose 4-O-acetylase-like acetyltransferase|nr:acyltransferase [Acidocella sp.]